MSGKYDDMLDLPHPAPRRHPRMPRGSRAAQFAPFSALTGYEAAVREAARLTQPRRELTEEEKAVLDGRLREAMGLGLEVEITYFRPDERKEGGAYLCAAGRVKRFDALRGVLHMEGGTAIPVEEIVGIAGEKN